METDIMYGYELLNDNVLLKDKHSNNIKASLYESHYFNKGKMIVQYKTIDLNGNVRQWVATKDPKRLSTNQRNRILKSFQIDSNNDEFVTIEQLFIHGEFIEEI